MNKTRVALLSIVYIALFALLIAHYYPDVDVLEDIKLILGLLGVLAAYITSFFFGKLSHRKKGGLRRW